MAGGTTKQAEMKDAKPGSYIMIDGEPCKVLNMTKSKPGKHGAAKVRLDAMGLFDNKKRALMNPASANIEVPVIDKNKGQVINVSGDTVNLMDLDSYETFDVMIPEDLKGKLQPGTEVLYWQFGQKRLIKQIS